MISSVIKACQAISSEVVLNNLLDRLVSSLLAQTGARRALVLLGQDGELYIEAEGFANRAPTDQRRAKQPLHLCLSDFTNLPHTLINQVYQTRASIVLENAAESEQFSSDGYIIAARPKSLACLPLLFHSALIGLIYLEDDLDTALFNAERIEILQLLAEQAAISIENSRLISDLREAQVQAQCQAEAAFAVLCETLTGTLLDEKYYLESKIGGGGFSFVYRARQLDNNRLVAIKILQPLIGSLEYQQYSNIELLSACRIHHANALNVYEFAVAVSGIAYLVMELLNGQTLTDELQLQPALSLSRCLQILTPVCDLLTAAHAAGIIHRDIKPDNIFLHQAEQGEVVKVLDFGIAKLIKGVVNGYLESAIMKGCIVGTPPYIAPERFGNSKYDGSSDVYSVGVMLYRMLAGRLPFQTGEDLWAVIARQMTQAPPSPVCFNPDLPDEIVALIMRTLSNDPAERPTPAELCQQFTTAVTKYTSQSPAQSSFR